MGLLPASTIIVTSPARSQASQPVSATTRADLDRSDDATSAIKAKAKSDPCPLKIQWDFNEQWIDCLIEFLSNNPDVCLRMFSDLVKDVRKESWKKVKTLL